MTTHNFEYEHLEKEYNKIFNEKVLPFIKEKIKKDEYSAPIYHLLENLNINRFRGSLPVIIAREYNQDENIILPLSAFFELTFTTAMAQDDYYDDDEFREGLIATHKLFGIKETLISCDYINHKIISIISDILGKNDLSELRYNKILKIINNGMILWYLSVLMEIDSKKDLFAINEEYVKNIYLSKTIHGRMLLECIFTIVENDENVIKIINKYGEHLAIAGQLKNDIYDFTKHKQYRGLSDLRQGHITWPLYLLIKSLNQEERNNFLDDLKNQRYDNLISLFKEKGIIKKTLDLITFHVLEAKKLIKNKLPENVREILNIWAEGNRNFSKEPKL